MAADPPRAGTLDGYRVLVVDDDATMREAVGAHLVAAGADGLEVVRRRREKAVAGNSGGGSGGDNSGSGAVVEPRLPRGMPSAIQS